MKYFIIAVLLILPSFALAQRPDYDPRQYSPQLDRGQRHCRHLYRDRAQCETRACMRYMDRRIRICMTR